MDHPKEREQCVHRHEPRTTPPRPQIETLVITGLTTQHCVSTTTRMAGNLGFDTYLVADTTAAFEAAGHDGKRFSADEIHEASLATLRGEFATVIATEAVLQRL